ncbi:MAG: M48 family metallopeptidase [Candidatus Pacebacteria bacterium]|nr:M48 family metallopeptidase [Candidatus Paceibacterota bacterium]
MATAYTHKDSNIRKTWFLMLAFFFVIVGVAWSFSYILESPVILWVAVAFSVLMNIGAYWFSDKVVLKMSGAQPVSRDSHRELWNILENLSITAGLPMPKLYIINDTAPNAFATGRDPEHAVVAVTSGLLSILERDELEGVIAHELSHIGNRDMLLMTVVVVLLGFVTLLSDFFLRMTLFGNHNGDRDGRAQLVLIVAGFALALLSPIVAKLIQLAISRKREFLADASGALLTRYPDGLASALEKISGYNAPMKRANHATAHLFISNPFGGDKSGKFLNKLFLTHPPVEERVLALRQHTQSRQELE